MTGIKGVRFRQMYQVPDDLLRFTDMPFDEVARRSGAGLVEQHVLGAAAEVQHVGYGTAGYRAQGGRRGAVQGVNQPPKRNR